MKKILFILLLFVQVYSDNNITIIQKLSFECDIGQSNSCVELAEIYFKDVNKNINYKKAAYFYEKACDYNNKYGCYNLGVMYRYGCNSVDRLADYEKALLFYTKACKLGKKIILLVKLCKI